MRFRVRRRTTGTTTTNPAQGRTYRRGCIISKWDTVRVVVVVVVIGIVVIGGSARNRQSREVEKRIDASVRLNNCLGEGVAACVEVVAGPRD